MKPIIGITGVPKPDPEDLRTRGKIELNWNYPQAVADAGGIPLIIPPMADMREIAEILDGWLIPGGDDMDASHFGQETHPKCEMQDPARFDGESTLMASVSPEMPVLGICYGCQYINVSRGGDLHQHLPDVADRVTHTGGVSQEYRLEPDSKLAGLFGSSEASGKSYHHQAVDRLGHGLRTVAKNAEDGTVEAVEATDRPWLIGVQWHPERTLEDPAMANLFKGFIDAARKYSSLRLSRNQAIQQ